MKKFLGLLFVLYSVGLQAQMALPSIFTEMKTVNPAVLTLRKAGNFRISTQIDSIKKKQEITNLDGMAFELTDNSNINLTNANVFRGGKGGGFTSEVTLDHTIGKRDTLMIDGIQSKSNYITQASSSYLNLSVGTPQKVGMGIIYVDYKSKYSFNQSVNGKSYDNSFTSKLNILGLRPGIVIGNPNLSLGILFEINKFSNSNSGPEIPTQKFIGFAVATGSPTFLLELGLEIDPIVKKSEYNPDVKTPMPMKLSLLIEKNIGRFTIGYKGMAFKGQYYDLDRIIQNQLVFGEPGEEVRLEHVFNFSLGKSSGFNLSGSASFSKTKNQEKSSQFISKNKHATESTAISASLAIGKNF